ncbi:MAG: type II toxin-antitoxin system RelE/ParE family toxin [Nitrospinae bacterium]|nr:type II toxin-antitoxin system RelE/ParE family toxin [Nitrospinota bacterium]MBL7021315.1 type II toxin-antitoxin system RelE/ParE family toxin [Nitrospinaceae bacterium]
MRPYELTKDAEADLEEIARYTIEEWGEAQAESYLGKISQCFKNITKNKVASRTFSEKFPDAQVIRCEHHYIFYLYLKGEKPIIFAVLHERMDMLTRLKNRLG